MATPTTLEHGDPLPAYAGERRIGPYLLLERLGEGGMGEVWLAEQSAPVQRQVALKLIRAGMDSRRVVSRFEVERQTLALMEHPVIARVFDGGQTTEGRPWFAMELVRGVPLNQYCDAELLTTRERLALFAQVCEGVQHAHQKAIIHRDLKPSNVLVSTVDGKAQPKIIDFGIAKATDRRFADGALSTEAGALVGTPEYMSPEQADPFCEDVDTRADVYSLGVLLYELLSGALPFSSQQLRGKNLDELRHLLREVDPPAPSQRLLTLGEAAPAVAQHRRTLADTLRRELRGDLDAITMKAMEKERSRRYATVGELSADLLRFLKNEPVLARPASAAYRLRKYARRHRAGVTISVIAALVLPAFTVGLAIQVRRVSRERDRANRLTEFTTGIFKVSDPSESRGNSITAREILDKAAADIDKQLSLDPELRAAMMHTMGTVYFGLGLYPKAQSLLERAIEIRKRTLGPEHRDTLSSMKALAEVQSREGRDEEAERTLRAVLEAQRRVLGKDDSDTLSSMSSLGLALAALGRFEEAERLQREALAVQTRSLGPEDPDTLRIMGNLAITLLKAGKLADAEALGREVSTLARRALGPDHPLTINVTNALSLVLFQEGRLDEAEALQRNNLENYRRVLGAEHPQTLNVMNNLGINLQQQGKLAESEKVTAELLAIRRRVQGASHPLTLVAMSNLANTLSSEGKFAEAEPLAREAVETLKRVLGPEHPNTLFSMEILASALDGQGRRAEVEKLLREVVATRRRVLGPKHYETLRVMTGLARAIDAAGRHQEAKTMLDEVLALGSALPPDDPSMATARHALACNAALVGQRAEALALLREAVGHGLPVEFGRGLSTEAALSSLRGDPAFESLVREGAQSSGR
jgi:serine/threonine protein kinase/Flp pilus assembly protein TadD